MENVPRIRVEEARRKTKSGEAMLVCAYEDDDVFRTVRLDGAISLRAFQSELPLLPADKEIIFYCA